MICISMVNKYCNEDISLIENYEEAINSDKNWECHHRKEIELDVGVEELKKLNLYYNRPAEELIFLTHADHRRLHMAHTVEKGDTKKFASALENNPWHNPSQESIEKMKATKKRQFESGEKVVWNKGLEGYHSDYKWFTNGTNNVRCLECPEGFRPGRSKMKKRGS